MRSKYKNKIYWLLLSVIIVASLITPYIIQKAIILGSEGDDDEESSFLMLIPPTPSNNSFPDDYFSFITKVNFIKGLNYSSNNLTDLRYDDGNSYDIQGEWDIPIYNYSVEFEYEFNPTYFLEHYNIFLYLKIDPSINPKILYFQGYNSTDWYNITEISDTSINIEHLYLEKTIKFRIFGEISDSNKIVYIDELYILPSHSKRLQNYGIINQDSVIHSATPLEIWSPNSNWWSSKGYPATQHGGISPNTIGWYNLDSSITFNMEVGVDNFEGYELNITHFNYQYNTWIFFADVGSGTQKVYIRDYLSAQWIQLHQESYSWSSPPRFVDLYFNNLLNENKFFDPLTNCITLKVVNDGYFRRPSGMFPISFSNLHFYLGLKLYTGYPEIKQIYTNPSSPLNTFEEFTINAEIQPHSKYIDNTEYYIENYSTEWMSMSRIDSSKIWENTDSLYGYDFSNGNYTVWVNATDTDGISVLDWYEFEVSNSFPRINFIKPSEEGEKITQLYNYNINVSVFDIEDDPIQDPEIIIYTDNISEPILDWTLMEYSHTETNGILYHYFNYSIDPIDFDNNLYKIRIRTNDTREIIVFNETTINIVNNPPSIEIIEPSLTELIIIEQDIICNVTNEEPINSVQWDIISVLNGFNWKSLNFNITTEFYESTFNLTDYEYGDYFLVINATDDKYNSSLEIKTIQIHPLLTYNIEENEISYNSIGIIVYSNPIITTDIIGQFDLDHHPIAKERDFEIYIPEKYNDAYKYYINRGFSKYEPVGFFAEGIYTLWNIPTYLPSDTIYFSLDKPIIINSLIEEEDDGTLKMEFILRSKHAFSGITIQNQLSKFISDPENYEYTLQFLYAGDWEDFDEDDYDVEAEDFPSFSFVWTSIGEGMEISFRFIAVPIEEEESAIGGGLLVGFVALALVELIAQIVLINRRRNRPEKWGWGKYILVSVGIGAGTFIAGFVAGLFLFG